MGAPYWPRHQYPRKRGRRRAANRAEWLNQADKPLEVDDIIGMPAIGLQNESARSKEAAQ
jgi:hypothetical protein